MSIRAICNALNKPLSPKGIAISYGTLALMCLGTAKFYQLGVATDAKVETCLVHIEARNFGADKRKLELEECLANKQMVYYALVGMSAIIMLLTDQLTHASAAQMRREQKNKLRL